MFEDVPIVQITIGPRFRQDLGNIPELAASIEAVGLLHPIVITTTHALLVGRRRLAAYVHLGRATIPAYVIDLDHPLDAELDENERRKNLNPSEKVAISEALHEHERQKAKERLSEAGKKAHVAGPGRGKKTTSDKVSEVVLDETVPSTRSKELPQVRDKVAAAVGWSPVTYAKAKKVMEAAREDEEFQPLVAQMDRTGNVSRAYSQLPRYMRIPPSDTLDLTIRKAPKPRPMSISTMQLKLDTVVQELIIPRLYQLSDHEVEHLRKLLRFYLELIDKERAAVHGSARQPE